MLPLHAQFQNTWWTNAKGGHGGVRKVCKIDLRLKVQWTIGSHGTRLPGSWAQSVDRGLPSGLDEMPW